MNKDVVIVGGGAAGFFTAINIALQTPKCNIIILEKAKTVLSKVKISGGGRCNVTHAEFVPNALAKNYPRGERELKGPFHTFCSGDTMAWFSEHGVDLKIEDDGRIFPQTDSSQTIIDCFLQLAKKHHIQVHTSCAVQDFTFVDTHWQVQTNKGVFTAKDLVIATGSSAKIWQLLHQKKHPVFSAVPSLFTFNIKDARIKNIPGVVTPCRVQVLGEKLQEQGPVLITHWGMSGPAILRLSAWGALALFQRKYNFSIAVNWLDTLTTDKALSILEKTKQNNPKKQLHTTRVFDIPKRLWVSIISHLFQEQTRWADLSKKQLQLLAKELTYSVFLVTGKSTFKEEFVTAGGVDIKQVNTKTFASKLYPNLYFAGEVLNVDAITGGFNFQNAWTTGYIAATSISLKYKS